jgi:hypothetical protein
VTQRADVKASALLRSESTVKLESDRQTGAEP